jgi:hypothetical protein
LVDTSPLQLIIVPILQPATASPHLATPRPLQLTSPLADTITPGHPQNPIVISDNLACPKLFTERSGLAVTIIPDIGIQGIGAWQQQIPDHKSANLALPLMLNTWPI